MDPTSPPTELAIKKPICDVLLSNHSVKAYGRDLADIAIWSEPGSRKTRKGRCSALSVPKATDSRAGTSTARRPWWLVKKYCKAAGIDPDRLVQRGIGIHSLRKTVINDAIHNGKQMREVRKFAGHSDIGTTEIDFNRKEEDGEVTARKIGIRVTGLKSE